MIEFLTLMLGLMIGPQTIELSADPQVASIRLVLDGKTVGVLDDGPPWKATIELGAELRPRRLEALAFDRNGLRVGAAQQILNYLRPSHEIGISLGSTGDEGRRAGRLIWRAVLDQDPAALSLRFDDEVVPVAADGSFTLPAYDRTAPHVLAAIATFPDGVESRSELAFGGGLGEEVTSALSPLAIRSKAHQPWTTDKVEGWIHRDGRPVGIFAARSAPRWIVLLRDVEVERSLRGFARRIDRLMRDEQWNGVTSSTTFVTIASPIPLNDHRGTFMLDDVPGGLITREQLRRTLTRRYVVRDRHGRDSRDHQELWPALAVAGQRAAANRGPRAVLLMVDEDLDPGSTTARHPDFPTTVDYLESIGVPLFVWAPSEEALATLDLTEHPRAHFGLLGLRKVIHDLDTELDSQTVVWVEGDVLPHEAEWSDQVPDGVDWVR
ncbi:MAG: hypothetical protein AAGE94_20050 [Acidobacteriota bacterium]